MIRGVMNAAPTNTERRSASSFRTIYWVPLTTRSVTTSTWLKGTDFLASEVQSQRAVSFARFKRGPVYFNKRLSIRRGVWGGGCFSL